MKQNIETFFSRAALYIFLGLLAYMPLHILLSTWIGTSFHILEIAKVAKDVILVLGFLLALAVSVRKPWFASLLRDKLSFLIIAFAGLNLLLALIKPTDQAAELLGLVYNTRFLMFFQYGLLLTYLFPAKELRQRCLKITLAAGAFVILFGLAQYFVIPNRALEHLGFQRANGVLPAFFIDEKPDLERVMSSIRDPNSLGSYLIIITSLAAGAYLTVRRRTNNKLLVIYFLASILCLWLTFSRSALLGLIVAAGVFAVLHENRVKAEILKRRKLLAGIGIVAVLIVAGGLWVLRNSYLVQNVIFHADQSTVLEDPNQLRVRFWRESIQDIEHHPEGEGPGTAGLVSIRNKKQGVRLNENYYLQIATETGVVGLLLFLSILALVAWRLFALRTDTLALALLASFAGLALTNFLVHIWANEAIAYTWWGLAGLWVARGNSHNKTRIRS